MKTFARLAIIGTAVALFVGLLLVAQTKPTLSDSVLKQYWRAQSEYLSAQSVAEQKAQALKAVVDQMRKTCEPGILEAGPTGDPQCAVKK